MDLLDAIKGRHSVRSYLDRDLEGEAADSLQQIITSSNEESGLNIQLCLNAPDAFSGLKAKYGKFKNVRHYIALIGRQGPQLAESCGYYGEKIVLHAQQLGLNTCWVGGTYSKGRTAAQIKPGEKLLLVIAVGYGETPGTARRKKPLEDLCHVDGDMPAWFRQGMEAAQLAPTALNQQKFHFTLSGDKVIARPGSGFYTKTDLGIVKYHFEVGAQSDHWSWAN